VNVFTPILGFFNKIGSIKKIWKKIDTIGRIKCKYQEFNCRIGTLYLFSTDTSPIFEPISIFTSILDKINELKGIEVINFDCQKCIRNVLTLLENILDILNKLDIIQKYKQFSTKNNRADCIIDFYNYTIFETPIASIITKFTKDPFYTSESDIIETYSIEKNEIFQILIFNIINEYEKHYVVKFSFQSSGEEDLFKKIVKDAKNNLKLLDSDNIIPIEELISLYQMNAKRYF